MQLLMEKDIWYTPTNQSLFFLEELANRTDYRLRRKKKSAVERTQFSLLE